MKMKIKKYNYKEALAYAQQHLMDTLRLGRLREEIGRKLIFLTPHGNVEATVDSIEPFEVLWKEANTAGIPIYDCDRLKKWQRESEVAQKMTHYPTITGLLPRIPYGSESVEFEELTDHPTCGDCAVAKGQLHIPSCDIEECPSCHGQFISCECIEQ